MEELGKEAQENPESETSVRSLSSERIGYYKKSVESIAETFVTLKKENIGPKYDELKEALDFFKETVQVETWKRGVGGSDRAESATCLNSLIGHYNYLGDSNKEKLYLRIRMNFDKKRVDELESK
jgi:hypothetical protein